MAMLQILNGAGRWQRLVPRESVAVLGRGGLSSLRLDDAWISREHARLTLGDDGVWRVEDLGSENGTFLNGVRIASSRLGNGDLLRLGGTEIRFFSCGRERLEVATTDAALPAPAEHRLVEAQRRLARLETENARLKARAGSHTPPPRPLGEMRRERGPRTPLRPEPAASLAVEPAPPAPPADVRARILSLGGSAGRLALALRDFGCDDITPVERPGGGPGARQLERALERGGPARPVLLVASAGRLVRLVPDPSELPRARATRGATVLLVSRCEALAGLESRRAWLAAAGLGALHLVAVESQRSGALIDAACVLQTWLGAAPEALFSAGGDGIGTLGSASSRDVRAAGLAGLLAAATGPGLLAPLGTDGAALDVLVLAGRGRPGGLGDLDDEVRRIAGARGWDLRFLRVGVDEEPGLRVLVHVRLAAAAVGGAGVGGELSCGDAARTESGPSSDPSAGPRLGSAAGADQA